MADSRLICVSLPAFPLQILQQRLNVPGEVPLVVVAGDRPTAPILSRNAAAAAHGVRPGMIYSQALSLSAEIRGGTVSSHGVDRATRSIIAILQNFSPGVEQSDLVSGAFWIDLRGIIRLFGGIGPWLRQLGEALREPGWRVRSCRGWTRAGTLLASLHGEGPTVFSSRHAESVWVRRQSLEALPFEKRDLERLRMLALTGIGRFMDIPPQELRKRFSPTAMRIRHFLSGAEDDLPVQRTAEDGELRRHARFEPPLTRHEPLRRALDRLVGELSEQLHREGRWIDSLRIEIDSEEQEPILEQIHCGRATRDRDYLLRLVALRFAHLRTGTRFVRRLTVDGAPCRGELQQGELPFSRSGGSRASAASTPFGASTPSAATTAPAAYGSLEEEPEGSAVRRSLLDRTIALVQAELGAETCATIVSTPGRFPEDRFALIPLEHGRDLAPRRPGGFTPEEERIVRVRRFFLEERAAVEGPVKEGPVKNGPATEDPVGEWGSGPPPLAGPYILSAPWWASAGGARRYEYRRVVGGATAWGYRHGGGFRWQGYLE